MKRIILPILIVLFCFNNYAQEQHTCGYIKRLALNNPGGLAKVNYPGDSNYDVNYYKLDLTIDYANTRIIGEVTIKANSVVNDLSSVFVDLKDYMVISEIKTGSQSLSFQQNNNIVTIDLDKSYNEGEEFEIVINYAGNPSGGGFNNSYFRTTRVGTPLFSTLSEPYSTSEWWPCKDTPADKADSADIWLTCSDSYIPVSNGKLMEIVENGSTHTYKWKVHYPIAQYLISVAMTNYDIYPDEFEYEPGKFLPVNHYVYKGTLSQSRISQLERTIDMLELFSDAFGEYPFLREKYGHAEWEWGGGMEHQTVSSMGSFGEALMSHELVHQWFGDKITCKNWESIWLNEGFATYGESLWWEHAYGFDRYMHDISSNMLHAKSATGSIHVQNINSVGQIFNGARSYSKGGVVLHMLRGVLGDDKFFKAIKAYINDPVLAYDVAVTEDFQRVAEESSGEDLDYFFSQWIYGENYPTYTVTWNYTEENNQYLVKVNIRQETNSEPKFFTMPVEFEIKTASGSEFYTEFNNQQDQGFEFILFEEPTQLIFDPNNWILKDASVVTSVDNFEELKDEFFLEQNYPNPFNPTTIIQYNLPQATNVKLTLFDNLGNEIITLLDEVKNPGYYNFELNSAEYGLSSGVYFYQLTTNKFANTKKMVLLK